MSATVFVAWFVLLRDLSVKSALLLLTAWALTSAMRRASAAARHLAWGLTFAALLLLPLLSVTLPARPVAVLPAPVALSPPAAPTVVSSPATPPKAVEAPAITVPNRQPAPPLPAPVLPPRPVAPPALPPAMPDWPALLCCLWLLGVALAAFPLVAGWTLAARRIRRCSPVTDPATLALAAGAGRRLGLRRAVSLRSGPAVSVPVTFGLMRPVILLPDGAASWPAERLRVALLHELAHVRRGDWATQTAARLACALFWHNPLVWPAARMLRAEAERACDDLVLSSGVPAPHYAQHLLAVAALSGADRPLPLAVPMAGRGPLESRLRAVLTVRPRRAPSRRLAALAFVLAFAVLIPLAALRPAARAARRIAPTLPLAPIVLPVPPKAVRLSHSPIKAAVAIPPTSAPPLAPTKSTPTGVPPMKPLTPVKAAALTALAVALTLPAATAQPIPPAPPESPAPPTVPVTSGANPFTSPRFPPPAPAAPVTGTPHWITFVLQHTTLATVRAATHWDRGGTLPEGVEGVFFLESNHSILVRATPAGRARMWEIVKDLDVTPEAAPAVLSTAPRQVQIKFEWVSSASAPNAAPDKNVETLTIIAEEGRKTQASSRHMRGGVGGEEAITVLAHLKPGGVVSLDITEHSDTTVHPGETVSNVTQTTVSVKDGDTGTVRGLMLGSKPGGQSAERVLFVTPTIVRPSADAPVRTHPAPLRDGDVVNVNPFNAFPPVGKGPVNPVPDKAP